MPEITHDTVARKAFKSFIRNLAAVNYYNEKRSYYPAKKKTLMKLPKGYKELRMRIHNMLKEDEEDEYFYTNSKIGELLSNKEFQIILTLEDLKKQIKKTEDKPVKLSV